MFEPKLKIAMSDHLLRQRRNLILVCVLLWFKKYGSVTLASKASLSGLDITIKNPDALPLAMCLAFLYFLFRYAQYFSTEGIVALRTVRDEALEEKCAPLIRAIVTRENPDFKPEGAFSYRALKMCNWVYNGQGRHQDALYPLNIAVPQRHLASGIVRAYVHIILVHNVVTDYILPFLLAGFIFCYYGMDCLSAF